MATNNHLLNCPHLRFPEFNDEWKQTTLGEVAEINPSTKDVLPHKFIYIDLEAVEKGVLLKHNIISKDNAPSRAQRLLKDHDVLFQMVRPYQQNNLYFRSVENIPSVASTGYAQLRSFQSGRFLYYAIHSATFLGEVLNRCTGTNYPAINATDLSSLPLSLPSPSEQKKIAEFLSLIDERIEAQRQTIKERKNQKKALLHQLFSQSLRFPEFEDEWQQTTLGRVAEIMKGSGISKDQLSPQGHPCILYGELYTKYLSEVIREIKSHTEIDPSSLILSQAGDVIIPSSGETAIDIAVARCVPVDNVALGGDLNIIRSSTTDGRFLAYQLNGAKKKEIAEFAQGVAVIHLYGRDLSKLRISLPILAEQQKIAEFLSLIDERVEVEEILLQKYEEQKRYLLRKMFV